MGSPQDQANLAPVDVRENSGWLRFVRGIGNASRPMRLTDARGEFANTGLFVGIVLPTDADVQSFRAARAMNVEPRKRGHQSRIPTPQELIRQVTGVGDPRGR